MPPWKGCIKRRWRELRGRKQNAINDNGRVCSLAFFYVLARGLCSIFISFHHGDLPALLSFLRPATSLHRRCALHPFASSPSASIVVGDGGVLIVLRHNNNCANDRARKVLRNRHGGGTDPFKLFSPVPYSNYQRDKTFLSIKKKRWKSYKSKSMRVIDDMCKRSR